METHKNKIPRCIPVNVNKTDSKLMKLGPDYKIR